MNYHNNFMNPKWQQLDQVLLPGGSEGPLVHPNLKHVVLVVGVELEASADCRATAGPVFHRTDAEMIHFRKNVQAHADLLPWMGNVKKKIERKELRGWVLTSEKHRDCRRDDCPYRKGKI